MAGRAFAAKISRTAGAFSVQQAECHHHRRIKGRLCQRTDSSLPSGPPTCLTHTAGKSGLCLRPYAPRGTLYPHQSTAGLTR